MGVFEWLRGALTAQQNYPMQYGQRPSSGVSQQGFSPQYGQSLSVGVAPPTPTFFGVHNGPTLDLMACSCLSLMVEISATGWMTLPRSNGPEIFPKRYMLLVAVWMR